MTMDLAGSSWVRRPETKDQLVLRDLPVLKVLRVILE